MGLMSPKKFVLGILCGYPATEVGLLIPSDRKVVQVRALPPAPWIADLPSRVRLPEEWRSVYWRETTPEIGVNRPHRLAHAA
jgi:hypothetical protein